MTDKSDLAAAREEIEMLKLNMTYFKYSHCEIEASCGGKVALEVREKVMERRAEIDGKVFK